MSDDSEATRQSSPHAKDRESTKKDRESTKIDKPARTSSPAIAHTETSFGPRYNVLGTLGKGGMGEVYRAYDTELETDVAIKVVLEDSNAVESIARFRREVALARKVTHPNVLRVYDIAEHEGRRFVSMEYVDGTDLAEMMNAGKLPLAKALEIFRQICAGLTAAHAAGIVHRDLKPKNVMVDKHGQVRIADFGLARGVDDPGLTVSGTILGSPAYMSPEQVKGENTDARSDIYALGVILYQLATGKVPFEGSNAHSVMEMRLHKPPRPPHELDAEIPSYIEAIALRCLAVDPKHRYQTVQALLADLESGRAPARPGSKRRMLVVGAAVLAGGIVGMAWRYAGRTEPHSNDVPATGGSAQVTPVTPVATSDRTEVLVLGFENRANEPTFDSALDILVEYSLRQSTQLDPISGFDVRDLANALGPEPLPVDDHLAAAVAKQDNRRIVSVRGSVAAKGAGFALSIVALDTAGKTLVASTYDAASLAEVVPTVHRLVVDVRVALGDNAAKDQAARTGLSDHIEPIREYALAYSSYRAGDRPGAALHLTEALARDPTFPIARKSLANVYRSLGRDKDANEQFALAIREVDKMTDRDRLRFLGDYYRGVTEDYDRAIASYKEVIATWPYEISAQVNLCTAYVQRGQVKQALDVMRGLVRAHPHDSEYRSTLVQLELGAGNLEAAVTEGRKVIAEVGRPDVVVHLCLAITSYLLGRKTDALAEYATFEHADAANGRIARADLAMAEGRLAEAQTILETAIREDVAAKRDDAAELANAMLAEVQLRRGNKAGAIVSAAKVVKAPERLFVAAMVQIASGDDKRASATRARMAKDVASGPRFLSKLLDAEAERVRGHPEQAMLIAQDAMKISDGWIGHFVAARAALDAGRFADAYDEIMKCQARRGEVALAIDKTPTLHYVPPLTYYLARAQDGLHSADAAASYRSFIAMEPGAEHDPLVDDAKRRLAK